MCGAGFERAEGVGDGTAAVVVAMELDVAAHDATQRPDQVIDLARVGDADGVSNTDAVDADLVHCAVDSEQIDQVAAEAVFAAEAHFQPLALDELNDFPRRLDNVGDVFAVRELA